MTAKIREEEKDGKIEVTADIMPGVELVGNFYDNLSNNGVVLFPGFNEHRSSLDELAKKLNKADLKVWYFDINSQGESTGSFNMNQIIESIYATESGLRQRYGLRKLGAHGNSVGGMAVGIAAAKNSPIECMCLTATPAGLQDIFPEWARNLLSYAPQSVLRYITIARDIILSSSNQNYRERTHKQFKTEKGYQPYAQWGAIKIYDPKELMESINRAPRLDDFAFNIMKPVLFVYGGEDQTIGIKDSELPSEVKDMYKSIRSKDKRILVVKGADHSLNTVTDTDDCFNQDPKFAFVKDHIVEHFAKRLN